MSDFKGIHYYNLTKKQMHLPFSVDGTEYRCLRREGLDGLDELWIRPVDYNVP